MAMNFPSSPVDGQQYNGYTYSASRGAWFGGGNTAMVIPSATPPVGANPNVLWLNTNDGVLFFRYDDGNSVQWVEMQNPASYVSSSSISSLEARIASLENRTTSIEQPPVIAGQIGTIGTFAAPAKVPFDDIWVQRGITYDSANRRFYVPTAGAYHITMNPFLAPNATGFRMMIGINNDAPNNATGHRGHVYKQNAEHDVLSLSSIVNLNANDYIVFYLSNGWIYNNTSDRFNQFTIQRIGS